VLLPLLDGSQRQKIPRAEGFLGQFEALSKHPHVGLREYKTLVAEVSFIVSIFAVPARLVRLCG
jgi:hypothetical protein